MSTPIQNNTEGLRAILGAVNSLPEASAGLELPVLSNPANASELFADKQLIDADGNPVTGTFRIDNELTEQDNLIAQIQLALQNKTAGSNVEHETWTLTLVDGSVIEKEVALI